MTTVLQPTGLEDAGVEATPRSLPARVRDALASGSEGARAWQIRLAFVAFAVVLLAWPHVALDDPTRIRQWAEYLCYAIIAVGLDLAWGYGGMLALGHGLFFGLGAYSMGMYLSLQQVGEGELPKFMALYGDFTELPLLWRPFGSFVFAVLAAVIVPMLAATLLGFLVFRNRIRGPFFALLCQATALIFSLVLIGNLQLTAGFNGLTDFNEIFGRNKYEPGTNTWLYNIAAIALLAVIALAILVVRSRYGKLLVATRDSEDRVRFLGYDPTVVKTVGFALSAGIAGLAGAIAAPVIGIVAPNQFAVLASILMVCWVAVGGRGTIWGAVLGAILVNWGRTTVSEANPDNWVYFQGLLFVVVLAFVPGGVAGLLSSLPGRLRRRLRPATAVTAGENA